MISQVPAKLVKLVSIMMEKISEVDILDALTLREAIILLSISHLFNDGWAHCQKQGKIYGDNFVTHFKEDIDEMFENGEHDKGAKETTEICQFTCSQNCETRNFFAQNMPETID